MTALSKGLLYLTSLHYLYLSRNDIDLEGAKAVLISLKGCYHQRIAVISTEHERYPEPAITVHDLISPDYTSAIVDLVAATECEKRKRTLDLGFKIIDIRDWSSHTANITHYFNVMSNWKYCIL